MNTQLASSCGWEVSNWWCPFTDLTTYAIAIIITVMVFILSRIEWGGKNEINE